MIMYKKNDMIEGTVTGIKPYGVFITLENGQKGLIHISEISDNFVSDINDFVRLGEKIKVQVVDIDKENLQYKLSIKNISYVNSDNENNYITEVGEGFENLRKCLNNWILDKKNEIFNKKN